MLKTQGSLPIQKILALGINPSSEWGLRGYTWKNGNISLHIKIEKLSIKDFYKGLSYKDKDKDTITFNYVLLGADQTVAYKNFTPPGLYPRSIEMTRKLTETDLSNLTEMPGFQVSWHYSGDEEAVSQPKYLTYDITKHFIRSN